MNNTFTPNKKILVIGINYYPELTGIGKYTAEFCNYLVKEKGYSVDMITGNPCYPQWKIYDGYTNSFKMELINGVTVHRCPLYVPENPSGGKRILQDALFFSASFFIVTKLLLSSKKFDAVFTPVPSFLLGLLGMYYRLFYSSSKVIYHIQDLQIDAAENLGMIKSKALINLLYKIEILILKKANYVSTISNGMKAKIIQKTPALKECLIFPNWINSVNIYPISPKPIPNYLPFNDKKIIFYSGAIGEKQGLEMLIDTAKHFNGNNDIAFVISGEGPYKKRLQEYATECKLNNLYFLNLLPIKEFNELLNAAFIHLVIQKEAGSDLFLPSKLTNILGVGGCVIVTAAPGTSLFNIIDNNKCGYLIPPSNLEALCGAIENLTTNPSIYKQLTDSAFDYAKTNLYQQGITEKYLREIGL